MGLQTQYSLAFRAAIVVVFWSTAALPQQFKGFLKPLDWAQYNGSVSAAYSTVYRGNYSGGAEGTGSHPGIDIPKDRSAQHLSITSPIHAIYFGVIVRKTVDRKSDHGWGNSLVIKHSEIPDTNNGTIFSTYAHLSSFGTNPSSGKEWQKNDVVSRGVLLGFAGKTGDATGIHLHFQLDQDYNDSHYPTHPFWPNRTPGSADASFEVAVPDSDDLVLNHTIDPVPFIESHLAPALRISTGTCVVGTSCSGAQGTSFSFSGNGFTPSQRVQRFILDSSGVQTELAPLTADNGGQTSWSFASSCSTATGTFTLSAIDSTTGKVSNTVTEIVTRGNCPVPSPVITIFPSPFDFGTVNLGSTAQKTFTISNPGTATLNVTGVNISSAGDFDAVFPFPPFNIAPGLTNTFTVFFHPTSLGLRQGMATLTSNASATPTSVPLSGTGSNALPPPATFMKTLGSPGDDLASSIQKTSDGGFIVVGYTTGLGAGREDLLLIKLDASGAVQWTKTAGGAGSDIAYSIRQTSDGGYIVSGSTDSVTGVAQVLLSKFDGSGTFQWASTLGNASDSAAGNSIQQTTDGGYIVTGIPAGAIGGLGLLKYDSAGQLQSVQETFATNHYGNSIQQTSDGGYIVTGNIQDGSAYDLSLLKLDGLGNVQWAQVGSVGSQGSAVQQTSDGGYAVTGFASDRNGVHHVLLLKFDGSGATQWARMTSGSFNETGDSLQQTSDGGYVVSGRTGSFGGTGQQVFLLKYDAAGLLQWAKAGVTASGSTFVQQTADGGYLVAGSTASFGAGGSDVVLIRTDANGDVASCASWSSVTPSTATSFSSISTNYVLSTATYGTGAPIFTNAAATLTSTNQCP